MSTTRQRLARGFLWDKLAGPLREAQRHQVWKDGRGVTGGLSSGTFRPLVDRLSELCGYSEWELKDMPMAYRGLLGVQPVVLTHLAS